MPEFRDKGYSVELGGQLIAAEAAGIAGRQQNATDLQIHHLDVSFYSISNISLISQSEKGGMLHEHNGRQTCEPCGRL